MKKRLIYAIGIPVLILCSLLFTAGLTNRQLPEGIEGPEAEALADEMLEAINIQAWDSLKIVQWTFMGGHHFLWDKERNYCLVEWKKNRVFLDIANQSGLAFDDGEQLYDDEAEKLIAKAYAYWCNDSFWLNAPAKIRDKGTTRKLVISDESSKSLLVTYTSGGVTPGDSYLWLLDDNGLPTAYRMWVSIIPIGGMKVSWEDWTQLEGGARIAQSHKALKFNVPITDLKGGQSFESLGLNSDPFVPLEN